MIHALENERVETIPPDRAKEFAEHGAVTDKINKNQENVLAIKHLSRSIIQKRAFNLTIQEQKKAPA